MILSKVNPWSMCIYTGQLSSSEHFARELENTFRLALHELPLHSRVTLSCCSLWNP